MVVADMQALARWPHGLGVQHVSNRRATRQATKSYIGDHTASEVRRRRIVPVTIYSISAQAECMFIETPRMLVFTAFARTADNFRKA